METTFFKKNDRKQQDSNLTAVVWKSWNILQTNKNLRELFQEQPMTAIKRNKSLKALIRGRGIENGKVKKFYISSKKEIWTSCLSGARNLCYNQVMTATTFMSRQTKQTFNIFFNLNWKSEFVIYLMECVLCKIQHVGKTEMTFNLILSNHSKGTKKPDSIPACKHFQQKGHNFNKHAKFIIADELINLHAPKETLVELLVGRENFCIRN